MSLDFELTGLDPRRDEIVSFGAVPIEHGRVQSRGALYREVRPSKDPTDVSIRIHNLTPGDLAGADTSESALPALRAALDGRFLLAWAAEIEVAFLSGLFAGSRRAWRRRTIDVMRLAMALDGMDGTRGSSYALETVADRLDVPVDEPHHALHDALPISRTRSAVPPHRGGSLVRPGVLGVSERSCRGSRVSSPPHPVEGS